MDELFKDMVPGFKSSNEIANWVSNLDPETRTFIKKATLTMKQLECLRWGTISKEEAENEIRKIKNNI